MRDEVLKIVCDTYKEVLDLHVANADKPKNIDMDTPIYGKKGYLDSLGLIIIVSVLESKIRDRFNVSITLVNESEMLRKNSPFETIETLTNYVLSLLERS